MLNVAPLSGPSVAPAVDAVPLLMSPAYVATWPATGSIMRIALLRESAMYRMLL